MYFCCLQSSQTVDNLFSVGWNTILIKHVTFWLVHIIENILFETQNFHCMFTPDYRTVVRLLINQRRIEYHTYDSPLHRCRPCNLFSCHTTLICRCNFHCCDTGTGQEDILCLQSQLTYRIHSWYQLYIILSIVIHKTGSIVFYINR